MLRYRSFLESLSLSAALDSSMPSGSAWTISRRTTFVVPALGSAMVLEVNSNKFSFLSVTRPCKRRNVTSGAVRNSRKPSMTDSKSRSPRPRDNPVYPARESANDFLLTDATHGSVSLSERLGVIYVSHVQVPYALFPINDFLESGRHFLSPNLRPLSP